MLLPDILHRRATYEPDKIAYTFLSNDEETASLSFSKVDIGARALGAYLEARNGTGERALLLYPSGPDFARALWGCFYSGTVAAPVACRQNVRGLENLRRIAMDCGAKFVLTTSALHEQLRARLNGMAEWSGVRWIATDQIGQDAAASWEPPLMKPGSLALLQYTSGSTSDPRGVMLTHENLAANQRLLHTTFGQGEDSVIVSWLPLFHDMGLIGNLLHATYLGARAIIMPPQQFLQSPVRWLRAITKYSATASGGPNFAYEFCRSRIGERDKAGLDLSSWSVAFNGSEPVRRHTLEGFAAAFADCGFRAEAFYPCYGLAEAALLVRGTRFDCEADTEKPESGTRVSLGKGPAEVLVVDPDTRRSCSENEIGEIWVRGPSVGRGYWGRAEESGEIFQAHLADSSECEYLRTGDLGFLRDGELFFTGRRKDVIVLRGANYYSEEIERTALESQTSPTLASAAAFTTEHAGEEWLVVVCELPRRTTAEEEDSAIRSIRRAVALEHEIEPSVIVFVRYGGMPKSSSGKVQRQRCREAWLEKRLPVAREWRAVKAEPYLQPERLAVAPGKQQIKEWLVSRIGRELPLGAGYLDTSEPFASYGLTSIRAVMLSGEMAEWLGRKLSATLLYEYPTIDALSAHLSGEDVAPIPAGAHGIAKPVAAVGCACRLPGARTPEEFWDLLQQGRDSISEVPRERWNADSFYDPEPGAPGKVYCRRGGFIREVDCFDNEFFGISLLEARSLDPQHRLLLELSVEALERSGQPIDSLSGSRTGVFIGISGSDYSRHHLHSGDAARIDAYSLSGSAPSFAAGRIAYVLGLHGPALSVDTACSSSLTAVHLACQSLAAGECDVAIAGGVNLNLFPETTVSLSRMRALSPVGKSKVFDAGADGYVRSEGCGIVVLKRLDDATARNDHILGVIAGTAVNQDGRSNGATAPNRRAQEALLRETLARGETKPWQISYVEAHGTGTPLGDPIELGALAAVLGEGRDAENPLRVGSVKANIGHLEAAAGIVGLIKALLILEHTSVPPQIHFSRPNPQFAWNETKLRVAVAAEPLGGLPGQQYVGVSSFGLSGSNAHVIVHSCEPAEVRQRLERTIQLFTLSAKTDRALKRLAARFADWLERGQCGELADICYSLNTGRAVMSHRLALVAATREELLSALQNWLANTSAPVARANPAEPRYALERLAERYVAGESIDWASLYKGLTRRRLILPTYPFERKRIWFDQALPAASSTDNPFPGKRRYSPLHKAIVFETALRASDSVFSGHRIGGAIVVPAAAYVAMALAGAGKAFSQEHCVLEDLVFPEALILRDDESRQLQAIFNPQDGGATFEVSSMDNKAHWTRHASGRLWLADHPPATEHVPTRRPGERWQRFSGVAFYEALGRLGFDYDSAFRWNEEIWQADGEVCAAMRSAQPGDQAGRYVLHPGQVDSLFQLVRALFPLDVDRDELYVPLSLARFEFRGGSIQGGATGYARSLASRSDAPETITADLELADENGALRAVARKLTVKRAAADAFHALSPRRTSVYLHEVRWQWKERHAEVAHRSAGPSLIIGGKGDFGPALAHELEAGGISCSLENRPLAPEQWREVLARGGFRTVIHARAPAGNPTMAAEDLCGSALAVAQAMASSGIAEPRLWLLTRGIAPPTGNLAQEDVPYWALWGLGNAIASERPELWGGLIDRGDGLADVAAIASEIAAPDEEDLIAFRSGARFVARLAPLADVPGRTRVEIRPDATYAVIGGLGSLGLQVVRRLVARGARRLLLTGRNATARAAAEPALDEWRKSGVEVHPLDCDLSSPADMARLAAVLNEADPPVRGVIHAAGILRDKQIHEALHTHLEVMAPKVSGAWRLHEATRDLPLDFLVFFSSLAGVTGSAGQSAYAAANAFLDGLAHHRRAQGLPALSLDWGPWADSAAVRNLNEAQKRHLRRQGVEFLDSGAALDEFERLLGASCAQVSVFRSAEAPVSTRPFLSGLRRGAGMELQPAQPQLDIERLRGMASGGRAVEMRSLVRRLTAAALGEQPDREIPWKQPFQELGMDSMMALELTQSLGAAIGRTLPPTLLYNYPTIEAVANHLEQTLFPCEGVSAGVGSHQAAASEVLRLSDQELEALVNQEFSQLAARTGTGRGGPA